MAFMKDSPFTVYSTRLPIVLQLHISVDLGTYQLLILPYSVTLSQISAPYVTDNGNEELSKILWRWDFDLIDSSRLMQYASRDLSWWVLCLSKLRSFIYICICISHYMVTVSRRVHQAASSLGSFIPNLNFQFQWNGFWSLWIFRLSMQLNWVLIRM